jgi:hypothetical protein
MVYVSYSIESHLLLLLFNSIFLRNVNNIVARGEKKVFFNIVYSSYNFLSKHLVFSMMISSYGS